MILDFANPTSSVFNRFAQSFQGTWLRWVGGSEPHEASSPLGDRCLGLGNVCSAGEQNRFRYTGSFDVIEAGIRIAAQMVGAYGMAGSLVSYEAIESGPIAQGIVGKVLGNEDARGAVEKLLAQAKADVQIMLDNHRHLVIALRDELLEKSELVGDEIVDVLREAEVRKPLDDDGMPGRSASR